MTHFLFVEEGGYHWLDTCIETCMSNDYSVILANLHIAFLYTVSWLSFVSVLLVTKHVHCKIIGHKHCTMAIISLRGRPGLARILQEGVGLFLCIGLLPMRGGGRLRQSS